MIFVRALLLLIIVWSSAAGAQTQIEQDRIDLIAKYTVTSAACLRFHASISPSIEAQALDGLHVEAASWSINRDSVAELFGRALARESKIFETDLKFASSHAKTDQELRNLNAVMTRYALICADAAKDQTFRNYITLPKNFEPTAAATEFTDSMIESGGIASWQTAQIRARGDLMMLAGACRKVIGPVKTDALFKAYGRSDVPRERNYYNNAFQMGLDDTELNFSAAQCERAIAKFKLAAAK
ncbi:MAG: hypothetical protein E6Q40_04485 [Cupriavidus sp.]|nr:MAG: hypothetical protein E6Q40_04485 [Cupriavidus sp.]